jgi:sirohydrochlorin cobaltochelatase
MRGIILFAHGAREAQWAEPFQQILAQVRTSRPGVLVELAFLELMTPTLEQAAESLYAKGVRQITVIPLFLAQGGHLRRDLPKRIGDVAYRFDDLEFEVGTPLGDSPEILEAISHWVTQQISE